MRRWIDRLVLPAVGFGLMLLLFGGLFGAQIVRHMIEGGRTPAWGLAANNGTIKGYADRVTARNGDTVRLFVTTPARSFDVAVFRLGWYDGGNSATRFITERRGLSGTVQPPPLADAATGLISAANWTSNASVTVDGWQTGLYLLKLHAAGGDENYIPLVVRDDKPHSYLLVHSAATDQAYNNWGGRSLYDFNSSGPPTIAGDRRAVQVSFDRPYEGTGAGDTALSWELNMVRWLERNGYDTGYLSDLELHAEPDFAAKSAAVLMAGHSEYWSREMRDHLETAVRDGKGLGLFTGDTGAWATRFEDSPVGPNRLLVCYKSVALDPLAATDPRRVTSAWDAPPLRPTHTFFGTGTNGSVRRSADWVVQGANALPDLFDGTGLKDGDIVPGLIGYEYDGLWTPGATASLPEGLTVLGQGAVLPELAVREVYGFAARYRFPPDVLAQAGRLSVAYEPGVTWSLFVELEAPGSHWTLEYLPGTTPPYRKPEEPSHFVFQLGSTPGLPGRQLFMRDLVADVRALAGTVPAGLRVSGLVLRGELAIAAPVFTAPDGRTATLEFQGTAVSSGWQIQEGKGELVIAPATDDGTPMLSLRPARSNRRVDQAHSVLMQRPGQGAIVAAGTIQWPWALDGFGRHKDSAGHDTPVDPRIQKLTANLLQVLTGTAAAPARTGSADRWPVAVIMIGVGLLVAAVLAGLADLVARRRQGSRTV